MTTLSPTLRRMLRRQTMAIVAAALLLVAGLGGWAATTEFSGAVIAAGQLVVDSNVKKVQHPTGGVVGELNVREGDHVKAGEIVVRLDDTQTRANLDIVVKALNELAARQAREEAERDGLPTVTFPDDLLARISEPDVARAITGERRQFETRRTSREGQKAQLRERIVQLRQEIGGYEAQIASKDKQIEWVTKELVGVYELWEKNLVPYTRVTSLEREKERLDGRARAADRPDRAVAGQDRRDRAAGSAGRPGHAHRGRQGSRRDPRQDVGAGRAQDRGRGSAQARRHPRSDRRSRASAHGSHRRRRDHGGRADHADRSFCGVAQGGGEGCSRRISIRFGSGRRQCCGSSPSISAPRRSLPAA